eukprot:UN15914
MEMKVGNAEWAKIIVNSISVDEELREERCKRTLKRVDDLVIAEFQAAKAKFFEFLLTPT